MPNSGWTKTTWRAIQSGAPGASLTLSDAQSRLPANAALLEYHTYGDHLVVAAVTSDDVDVVATRVFSRELAALVNNFHAGCSAGWGPPDAAEALSQLLLEPVREVVAAQERLVIVPFGPLALVPFHVLPFDGAALGLASVVSYAPSAAVALSRQLDKPFELKQTLVIGDPAFDPAFRPRLPRLPAAQVEARDVASCAGVHDPWSTLTPPKGQYGSGCRGLASYIWPPMVSSRSWCHMDPRLCWPGRTS
jgi:CHAT domain-containing protein